MHFFPFITSSLTTPLQTLTGLQSFEIFLTGVRVDRLHVCLHFIQCVPFSLCNLYNLYCAEHKKGIKAFYINLQMSEVKEEFHIL